VNWGAPEVFLCLAMFFGGFISGVSGFAFSAVAGAVLLHVYPPKFAVPLMMICALLAQLYSVVRLRRRLEWSQSLRLIVGGMLGMPLGLWALRAVDAHDFRIGFGIFLSAYAAYMLFWPTTVTFKAFAGNLTSVAIGFVSGIVGGLTAFPGALPTMWCDLRGLPKDLKRGITQPFIAFMQFFGFSLALLHGDVSENLFWDLAISLPALAIGTVLGLAAFGKVNDLMFRRIVLTALLISGLALI
jgi:uncharacterized membrane protein YfcA